MFFLRLKPNFESGFFDFLGVGRSRLPFSVDRFRWGSGFFEIPVPLESSRFFRAPQGQQAPFQVRPQAFLSLMSDSVVEQNVLENSYFRKIVKCDWKILKPYVKWAFSNSWGTAVKYLAPNQKDEGSIFARAIRHHERLNDTTGISDILDMGMGVWTKSVSAGALIIRLVLSGPKYGANRLPLKLGLMLFSAYFAIIVKCGWVNFEA